MIVLKIFLTLRTFYPRDILIKQILRKKKKKKKRKRAG